MANLPRRRFLLGTGAVVLLAACGDDGADSVESPATTSASTSVVLGTAFNRNTYLVAGRPQRSTFVFFDEAGGFIPLADAPDRVPFTLTPAAGGTPIEVVVDRRGDDLDRPYYPADITFPSAGVWDVAASLPTGAPQVRQINVNESVPFPQVGDPLPVLATPTVAEPLDAATLCTRVPACPFHEVSLDDALAAGSPVAVLISTPRYCRVFICGPVLDLLIDAPRPDGLAVIHVEVYPNGTAERPGDPTPILLGEGFAMDFEPALYIADASGTVTSRLDSIYDGDELAEALARV